MEEWSVVTVPGWFASAIAFSALRSISRDGSQRSTSLPDRAIARAVCPAPPPASRIESPPQVISGNSRDRSSHSTFDLTYPLEEP